MTGHSIVAWLASVAASARLGHPSLTTPPYPHALATDPAQLPSFVRDSAVAMRYRELLAPLAWERFPERSLRLFGRAQPVPFAPFAAACLIKLDQQLGSMGRLRQFLVEHPPLLWLLGFPLVPNRHTPCGFDPDASLPTARHFTRLLRQMPNAASQFLLDSSVAQLQTRLAAQNWRLGEVVSLDTKHILAWVKENNPKVFLRQRYDKTRQPPGDPDCRLGCKRRHNRRPAGQAPDTPHANPVPAKTLPLGEFYWGYASGVVATRFRDGGECVLAEFTQPFDRPDVAYFFPLMHATEQRLGFRPPHAALDAAFDAFYVYDYFDAAGGFAAVPFSERGGHAKRQFNAEGLPLCAAGLPMPLKYTFTDRSSRVEHERGRYACPLRFPPITEAVCPVNDPHWKKGGCLATFPLSRGARLRCQLDRDSQPYQEVYSQRTATERINSQALALGIERPRLRNGLAIANLNTLIYVLINLRTLQRLAHGPDPEQPPISA